MQISGNNSANWMQPALDVVKRVEPATYARMQSANWPVCVVDGPDDIDWVMHDGLLEWLPLLQEIPAAFGVTRDPHDASVPRDLKYGSFLNRPAIEWQAGKLDVSYQDFLADVLVHEFAHREHGNSEPDAFAAGTKFGLEMGSKPIADLSEATRQQFYGDDA